MKEKHGDVRGMYMLLFIILLEYMCDYLLLSRVVGNHITNKTIERIKGNKRKHTQRKQTK